VTVFGGVLTAPVPGLLGRDGQCFPSRPAALKAPVQDRATHSNALRPFGDGHCLAVESEGGPVPPVVGLLFGRSPSAVAGLVVSSVVDAVDGVPRWASTHIAEERLERVKPLAAHANTATTIAGVIRPTRVYTSTLRSAPCLVFLRPGLAVGEIAKGRGVYRKTTATPRVPLCKIATLDDGLSPAFATAEPADATSYASPRSTQDSQATEGHSRNKVKHTVPVYQIPERSQ
jgi:hypothetical protein